MDWPWLSRDLHEEFVINLFSIGYGDYFGGSTPFGFVVRSFLRAYN
jgi:hypothetical protein